MKQWVYRMVFALIAVGLIVGCSTPAPTATFVPAVTPVPAVADVPAATPLPTNTPVSAKERNLILATTTSTENSGLLAYLLPDFEAQYNVKVDVVAVGTGQALVLGEDGNADVLLVHARAREDAFIEAGHGVRREDVMYNDFVIVGPKDDPAGINGTADAAKALAKIAEAQASFVSRGDDSGTHTKEKAIWSAAEVGPSGDWYIAAGQGMGAVLTMADEQQAYTLCDRATYLARTLEGISLDVLVEGDLILFNPYGVMAVNPNKNDKIKNDLANLFIAWLISLPTQEKIAEFGVAEFGAPLFTPDSTAWRETQPKAEKPTGGIPDDAALKITGAVEQEIGWTEDQVKAMETMEAQSTNNSGETKS